MQNLEKLFVQYYRYGLWKVRYTIHTRNVRLLEYVPGLVFLASIVLGFAVSPLLLLAYPALGVAETVFVVAYRRPAVRLVPLMLVGWWVKNTGWSLGVLGALVQPASWRPPAPGKHHSLTSAG